MVARMRVNHAVGSLLLFLLLLNVSPVSVRAEDAAAQPPGAGGLGSLKEAGGSNNNDAADLRSALEMPEEEDESELTYEPSLDYSEEYMGQAEDDSDQDLIEAERAYFVARDHDGDGGLNKEEFIRQLNDVDIFEEDDQPVGDEEDTITPNMPTSPKTGRPEDDLRAKFDTWNISERGRDMPSAKSLTWGKDWTAKMPKEEAEASFKEFDADADGLVTWEEWKQAMFHEDAQIPAFRDGIRAEVRDPMDLADDEINPEDLEEIKNRFKSFDADKDEHLTAAELFEMMKSMHDNPENPDGVMNYTRPDDSFIEASAKELHALYDNNGDKKLSMEEWVSNGGI